MISSLLILEHWGLLMLVSLDGARKNNTVYLRDSLILQEKIFCHIGYVRICSGLPVLITASHEWPLWVIVQFSMMLLRRSVQSQLIRNHPYGEITSYLFFTNNSVLRKILHILSIHLQRQKIAEGKDLCWFAQKSILQEGQSLKDRKRLCGGKAREQTGKKRGKMCNVENAV